MKSAESQGQPAEDSQQEQPLDNDGVTVPEEFQKQAHALVHKAPKAHLSHLRDRINIREDELRQEEMAKKPKGKGAVDEYAADPAIE